MASQTGYLISEVKECAYHMAYLLTLADKNKRFEPVFEKYASEYEGSVSLVP